MKVVAIIQARMGSTRLPGKVLEDIAGRPMLELVLSRSARAAVIDEIVVATTTSVADDAIVTWCRMAGWSSFRGSEPDVLDRYYRAALDRKADAVVRITSDCPLIEPAIVDRVVTEFLQRTPDVDYCSNAVPRRTFPVGLDTEVMTFEALERAWREESRPGWREHVTPYIHRHPELFRRHSVINDVDYSHLRWTVDAPEDLQFVRAVYSRMADTESFSWLDVLCLLDREPALTSINRYVKERQFSLD